MPGRPIGFAAALACAALFAFAAGAAPAALADGDPASDVLLGQNVFYPYQPPVSGSIQRALDAETASARRAGFPLKVALIASPVDLGVIPDLFGQPQRYADFLDQEISFQTKQPLLVVMPSGYGVTGVPESARSAVGSLPAPAGKQSDALARAAIAAVSRLSAAAGHPIKGGSGGSGDGGGVTPIVLVLILAAVATAAALATLTLRRRREAASG